MSSIPTNSSTLVSSSSRLFSKLSTCKTHLNAFRVHNLQGRAPGEPQSAEHKAGAPRPPAHLLAEGATLDQQVRAIGGGGCAERRVQRVPVLVLLPAQPGGVAVALRDVPAVPAGAVPRRLGPYPRSRHTAARPPVRRRLHHVNGRRRMRGDAASRPAPWPPGAAPLLTAPPAPSGGSCYRELTCAEIIDIYT